MRFFTNLIPGFLLVICLAVIAFILSKYVSLSANLIAILLGSVVTNLLGKGHANMEPGIQWCESKFLAIAVALLGAQLNLSALLAIDGMSLLLIISGLFFTFLVTLLLAKTLRVNREEACLVASGQGVCGTAAVMASQSIIKVPAAQAGLVVAVVNFLGFVGVFVAVWLSSVLFNADAQAAGLMIGNTLQSMGHVVAAGFSMNDDVGQMAVLVKMCRILLLIPVLLLLILIVGNRFKKEQAERNKIHWLKLIPIFIWVFLLLCGLASIGWLPENWVTVFATISKWLFLLAMAAIGLNIEFKHIYQSGGRILLLGILVFSSQLLFSAWILLNI